MHKNQCLQPDTIATNSYPNFINDKMSKSVEKYSLTSAGLTVVESDEESSVEPLPELKTEHIKIYDSIIAYYSWLALWFGAECSYVLLILNRSADFLFSIYCLI